MIEGIIIFTGGLMFGVFTNLFTVLKNQSFHSKRIDELEKQADNGWVYETLPTQNLIE